MEKWAGKLNEWGYHAVVLDSIGPRGAQQICTHPFSVVTQEQRSRDAFDAANWVLEQSWSSGKVGLIGFSHGAAGVIYSAASRYVERNLGKQVVSAGIAYYPRCDSYLISDKPVIPIQIHIGERDNWTAASPCKALAIGWKSESEYFQYKDATHGFDAGFTGYAPPDPLGVRHYVEFNQQLTEQSQKEVKRFFNLHLR